MLLTAIAATELSREFFICLPGRWSEGRTRALSRFERFQCERTLACQQSRAPIAASESSHDNADECPFPAFLPPAARCRPQTAGPPSLAVLPLPTATNYYDPGRVQSLDQLLDSIKPNDWRASMAKT